MTNRHHRALVVAAPLAATLAITACTSSDDSLLPPETNPTIDASIDTSLPNVGHDAHGPDTSHPDTSLPDTSPIDTSVPDTTEQDTAQPDTSQPDTAQPDTSQPDTSVPDANDASVADAADAAVATPPPDYIWYVLDETSGTTAHDSSSHHLDITNLTGVTWNAGASFDGVSGGGYTTVDQTYRTPPITITAWLKPAARADSTTSLGSALQPFPPNALSNDVPSLGGYGVGLNVWTDGNGGSLLAAEGVDTCTKAGLCAANSTQNAEAADGGDAAAPSCTSATSCSQGFVAGSEYFVAVAISPPPDAGSSPSAKVYVNGAVFDDTTAYVPPAVASTTLYLGCHNLDTNYGTKRVFDGRIRDVRVYQRELGGAEIGQLFTNGPTLKAPPPVDGGASDASSD